MISAERETTDTTTDMRGGIDLGGTKIQAVVVDAAHDVRGEAKQPTPTAGGPADVAAAIAATLREAADAAGVETSALHGVGVGSPGEIDAASGTVGQARNLPGWEGTFPLADELARQVGAPVRLGNDVQVAIEAEVALGAGREYGSLLGVFWGTGIGGAIVLDRRSWLGRGIAGELGHVVVVQDGRRCPCGRLGCLEAYAGRSSMEARARELVAQGRTTVLFELMEEKQRTRLTSGIWARALKQGDALAHQLVDEAVEAIGTGVASAINLLDVEAVIVGGGLGVRLGEPYRDRIAAAMLPHLFNDDSPPAVHVAGLGDLGGALGAALLVEETA
jgi:glucokinase